jgi:hypothetical protein
MLRRKSRVSITNILLFRGSLILRASSPARAVFDAAAGSGMADELDVIVPLAGDGRRMTANSTGLSRRNAQDLSAAEV